MQRIRNFKHEKKILFSSWGSKVHFVCPFFIHDRVKDTKPEQPVQLPAGKSKSSALKFLLHEFIRTFQNFNKTKEKCTILWHGHSSMGVFFKDHPLNQGWVTMVTESAILIQSLLQRANNKSQFKHFCGLYLNK